MRPKVIAGNWKMNLDRTKARELAAAVAARRGEAAAIWNRYPQDIDGSTGFDLRLLRAHALGQ